MATKTPIDETVEVETKTGKTVYVRVADLSKAELDPASRMTMRNISGSTPYKTGKGWLAAWKKVWGYKGDNNPDCAIKTCGNKAKVGGHVCYNTPPGEVYIIPICGQCNSTSKDETAKVLKKECDGHRELVRAIKQKGYKCVDGKIVDEVNGLAAKLETLAV